MRRFALPRGARALILVAASILMLLTACDNSPTVELNVDLPVPPDLGAKLEALGPPMIDCSDSTEGQGAFPALGEAVNCQVEAASDTLAKVSEEDWKKASSALAKGFDDAAGRVRDGTVPVPRGAAEIGTPPTQWSGGCMETLPGVGGFTKITREQCTHNAMANWASGVQAALIECLLEDCGDIGPIGNRPLVETCPSSKKSCQSMTSLGWEAVRGLSPAHRRLLAEDNARLLDEIEKCTNDYDGAVQDAISRGDS